MRATLYFAIALTLAGCTPASPKTIRVTNDQVSIVRYIDVPARYTDTLVVPAYPAGALNWQVLDDQIHGLEAVISKAQSDRIDLRALSGKIVQAAPSCPAAPVAPVAPPAKKGFWR